jgi:subfamily B ATP-binding cassette protein MsbA
LSETSRPSTWSLGRRLWRDWVAKRPVLVVTALILSAIFAAASGSYALLVSEGIDMLEARDPSFFPWAPIIVIGLTALRGGTLYLQALQTNRIALHVMQDMQNAMFRQLVRADFARLQSEPTGSLISRFTNDITLLRETLVRLANNLARDTLTVIFTIGVMFYLDWVLTLMILVVYPIAFYPVIRIGQRLRKTSSKAQSQMGEVTGLLEESFSGARMVKTYGLEAYESRRAENAFAHRLRFLFGITENKARVDPILEAAGGLAIAALFGVAGWRLLQGETTLGPLIGVLGGAAVIAQPIRALGTLNAVVQEGFAVLERVFAVLDADPAVRPVLGAPKLVVDKGELALADVRFAYGDGTAALDGVSLKAKGGKTVALVGPSGSGKSTVLNLIPRLYDVTSGEVRIDAQDVRGVTLESLRENIALVSQDVTLFDDTVRANIALGRLDASDEEIVAAAQAADAHDFIMAMPGGYDAPVGPGGGALSGGQRQRLSIARALLKDAPILLLDEATSALDTESERRVQAALHRLSEGRTTLVIAHRLSTVREADWIYVMEDGRVREEGRHADLIETDGLYAKLCALQLGDEADRAVED